jgi:hypothetical protein
MFAVLAENPEDEKEWLETATDQAIEACGGNMRAHLRPR